ncbi:hypothetical protein ElyMa_005503400 [Elysia marginata]|uniref:Uncharacterized protein n=1 Tax=Elysia marginata TaxID=1093978 RepID=A0AAV4EVD6_9GAST|nr:hypothetical protein ElyMa_005503400 [Elysia marginata]
MRLLHSQSESSSSLADVDLVVGETGVISLVRRSKDLPNERVRRCFLDKQLVTKVPSFSIKGGPTESLLTSSASAVAKTSSEAGGSVKNFPEASEATLQSSFSSSAADETISPEEMGRMTFDETCLRRRKVLLFALLWEGDGEEDYDERHALLEPPCPFLPLPCASKTLASSKVCSRGADRISVCCLGFSPPASMSANNQPINECSIALLVQRQDVIVV